MVETVTQPPPEVRVLEDHESVRGDDGLVEGGVEARSFRHFTPPSIFKRTSNGLAQEKDRQIQRSPLEALLEPKLV